VADRRRLLKAAIGSPERFFCLDQVILREQRAAQHELRDADSLQVVGPIAEERKRPRRLILGQSCLGDIQVNLCQRRQGRPGLGLVADLERDLDRVREKLHGLLGIPERMVQQAEVVQQPADRGAVVQLFVVAARPLRVLPREQPAALPLGDERRLEVRLGGGALVVGGIGELECPLDVLAGREPVALAAVAAGTPVEDVCAEQVARQAGSSKAGRTVTELERL